MNVTILGHAALTCEFYTSDFSTSEQSFTCTKVEDLIPGTFSEIKRVQCSNDESKNWILKLPNQKGLEFNGREAKILKGLNAHEKYEGKEYCVQMVAFFTLGIEDLGLSAIKGIGGAPIMLFPHHGIDLFDRTKKDPLLLQEALDIARQLFEIASFLIKVRLIHRDIKPENLLIDETGKLRLADFGSAIWEREPTEAMTNGASVVAGTTQYLSPEVLIWIRSEERSPFPPYSFASDLWAIGSVLFNSISRSNLFAMEDSLSFLEKLRKIIKLHKKFPTEFKERLLSIPGLDQFPVLENILKGTLNMNPTFRMTPSEALDRLNAPIESAL